MDFANGSSGDSGFCKSPPNGHPQETSPKDSTTFGRRRSWPLATAEEDQDDGEDVPLDSSGHALCHAQCEEARQKEKRPPEKSLGTRKFSYLIATTTNPNCDFEQVVSSIDSGLMIASAGGVAGGGGAVVDGVSNGGHSQRSGVIQDEGQSGATVASAQGKFIFPLFFK